MHIGTRARYLLFLIELALCLIYKGFLVSIFWNIYINSLNYMNIGLNEAEINIEQIKFKYSYVLFCNKTLI